MKFVFHVLFSFLFSLSFIFILSLYFVFVFLSFSVTLATNRGTIVPLQLLCDFGSNRGTGSSRHKYIKFLFFYFYIYFNFYFKFPFSLTTTCCRKAHKPRALTERKQAHNIRIESISFVSINILYEIQQNSKKIAHLNLF